MLVDDFWGDRAWENWEYEVSQVLPPEEYPMVTIPLDHQIFHIVFDLNEVPQFPGIRSFYTREGRDLAFEIRWIYNCQRFVAQRAGTSEVCQRIQALLRRLSKASDSEIREARFPLRDGQSVVAPDYGFTSWAKLNNPH